MINESKILFDKIKSLRRLNEGVGQADIIDAINNRKIVVIQYKGEHSKSAGYRTIQPHVLGVSEAGNVVLRAWEENGESDSFRGVGRVPRRDHEYFVTNRMKPGWRLFRLDGILSMSATGRKFSVTPDDQRPLYKPNDRGMANIIAVAYPAADVEVKGTDKITEPNTVVKKISTRKKNLTPKEIDQIAKTQNKDIKNIVTDLYRRATRYAKEKTADKIVVYKNGDFFYDFEKNRGKYNPNEILGNLKDLFTTYSGATRDRLSPDWQKNISSKAKNDIINSINKKNTQPIK